LIQRACAWGGESTPEVSEYCAAGLGALQGTGMAAARALIADALDVRYRLPRWWGRVLTGGVRAWQARRIAGQTRVLSWEACADVARCGAPACHRVHRRPSADQLTPFAARAAQTVQQAVVAGQRHLTGIDLLRGDADASLFPNSRNGSSPKTVSSEVGDVELGEITPDPDLVR
jgi:hypothetical protein